MYEYSLSDLSSGIFWLDLAKVLIIHWGGFTGYASCYFDSGNGSLQTTVSPNVHFVLRLNSSGGNIVLGANTERLGMLRCFINEGQFYGTYKLGSLIILLIDGFHGTPKVFKWFAGEEFSDDRFSESWFGDLGGLNESSCKKLMLGLLLLDESWKFHLAREGDDIGFHSLNELCKLSSALYYQEPCDLVFLAKMTGCLCIRHS